MKKLLVALAFSLLLAQGAQANSRAQDGWVGTTVWGKYVPVSGGQQVLGEVSELRDVDSKKLVGYEYDREVRSIFIMVNGGQPTLESWDFPNLCPPAGCSDSDEARVTFVPYKDKAFTGKLHTELDNTAGRFRIMVGKESILEIDTNTANIASGIITEDLSVAPQQSTDPAVECTAGITCVRSLAYGELADQDLKPTMVSKISWKDGSSSSAANAKIYRQLDSPFQNELLYQDEASFFKALHP